MKRAGHVVDFHDPALGMEASGPTDAVVVCAPCLDGLLPALPEAKIYVVRSTVKPEAFDLLPEGRRHHWPEFLTERTAEYDAAHPDKIIWGSDLGPQAAAKLARDLLGNHYHQAASLFVSLRASCLIKIGINTIYTSKVLLANALYEAAGQDETEYLSILRGLGMDKRLKVTHGKIWQDDYRGAGGKCLPKDTRLLAELLEGKTTGRLIRSMIEVNDDLRAGRW